MANQPNNFDFRSLLEELASFARDRAGAFASKTGNAKPTSDRVEIAVLAALASGSKNAKQIAEAIALSSGGSLTPSAGDIRTTLERLVGESLVSAETKKDRKVYSLTKAGQTKLGEETKKMAGEPAGNAATSGMSSSWLSFDPSFLSTASKLGPVLLDLAQTGTKTQQEKATKVLEETRHQLHKILADN